MEPTRFALRGGLVVVDGELVPRDVLVDGERIAAVDTQVDPSAETVDASGRVVLPGAVDVHVHFREPGDPHKEDFGSGSRAALAGGVTTILDMPNTRPPTTTRAALADKLALAAEKCVVDFGLYMGVTDDNGDEVRAALGEGHVVALKIYLAPSTGGLVATDAGALRAVFDAAASAKVPVAVHAEDACCIDTNRAQLGREPACFDHGRLRDIDGAVKAVARALEIAHAAGAHVHIAHLSSTAEAALVREARARGTHVTCEAAPHHLLLDERYLQTHGCLGKVNPPLRPAGEPARLFQALRARVIDMVATDHAPHLLHEKAPPYDAAAAGLPGVELFYPLLLNEAAVGRLSLGDVVRLAAEAPARIFKLARKGRVAVGCDADLVLADLDQERVVDAATIKTRAGWSPYAGRTLRGWVTWACVRGQRGAGGRGRRVERGEA